MPGRHVDAGQIQESALWLKAALALDSLFATPDACGFIAGLNNLLRIVLFVSVADWIDWTRFYWRGYPSLTR